MCSSSRNLSKADNTPRNKKTKIKTENKHPHTIKHDSQNKGYAVTQTPPHQHHQIQEPVFEINSAFKKKKKKSTTHCHEEELLTLKYVPLQEVNQRQVTPRDAQNVTAPIWCMMWQATQGEEEARRRQDFLGPRSQAPQAPLPLEDRASQAWSDQSGMCRLLARNWSLVVQWVVTASVAP